MHLLLLANLLTCLILSNAFSVAPKRIPVGSLLSYDARCHRTTLYSYSPNRSSSSRSSKDSRSKRQERVGQLVKSELSQIIQSGNIKLGATQLNAATRHRISIVSVDVSPDLKQARVSVSIRASLNGNEEEGFSPAMEQRRAYSWLVGNTKELRHSLAQRMSHMKSCPMLTFVKVDVGAAVDVMDLIDKVSKGYKRQDIDLFGGVDFEDDDDDDDTPSGILDGVDFDEDLDDDEWAEEDDDFL